MANFTDTGNHTTDQQLYNCSTDHHGVNLKIFISALNIPLSIIAFLGNILIIAAFQKVSSLGPPSKLLFACLAGTDLCVGLITQPLFVIYLLSNAHSKLCYYAIVLNVCIGAVFCGVSLSTVTAISLDRFLALMLGVRYREIVTLKRVRVLVVTFWLLCITISFMVSYDYRIAAIAAYIVVIICIVTSTFCYTKIFLTLRHRQVQAQDHVHQGQPNLRGGNTLNIARYRKTVYSALWVQMALLVCYLPYSIEAILGLVAGSSKLSPQHNGVVTFSLVLLNSSLNPFLYCWKMKEVRQAVKGTIRQFCCFSR